MLTRARRLVGSALITLGVRILYPAIERDLEVASRPVPPVVRRMGSVGLTEEAARMVEQGRPVRAAEPEERDEVLVGSLQAQGRR